jgi:hypothetical protein
LASLQAQSTSWDYLENNSRICIGGEGFHRTVKVHGQDDEDTEIKFEGGWGGVYAAYRYEERDAVFFQLDGRGSWGALHPEHEDGDFRSTHNNSEWNVESLLGYMFGLGDCNQVGIAPFFGIGYQKNHLLMAGSRHLRWWYVPFGALIDYQVTPSFTIGLFGDIGLMFNGHYHFNPVDHSERDRLERSGKIHNKYNWELEAPFTFIFADWCDGQMDISVIPFWHGWLTHRRGDSHERHGVPGLRSSEGGARLEFGWRF